MGEAKPPAPAGVAARGGVSGGRQWSAVGASLGAAVVDNEWGVDAAARGTASGQRLGGGDEASAGAREGAAAAVVDENTVEWAPSL